jgi:hypothetical protein
MKVLILLLLLSSCFVDRLVDRIETPHTQLWFLYTEGTVVDIDTILGTQKVYVVCGSPYPKYCYWFYNTPMIYRVGDIVPITDSLRGWMHVDNNWNLNPLKTKNNEEPIQEIYLMAE